MQKSEYDAWLERHAAIFGVTFEADLSMLMAWWPVLGHFDRAELDAATDDIARSVDPPRYLRDHLAALQRHVRGSRAVAYRREDADLADQRGTCADCGGTGRVVVPHPRGVVGGGWQPIKAARGGAAYYTAAVLCHCGLGSWVSLHIKDAAKCPMRLEAYQRLNPDWRRQLAQRRQLQAAEAALTPGPDWWPEVVTRLFAMYGVREPGVEDE